MTLRDRDREKWTKTSRDWKPPKEKAVIFLGTPVESDLEKRAFSAKSKGDEWLETDLVIDLDEAQ